MPYKDKEKRNLLTRKHYARNKSSYARNQYQRRLERLKWFYDMKATLHCEKCGEDHPACLEFHHEDPDEKESNISSLVGQGASKERILKEMSKCKIWCSNCHQKHHYETRLNHGNSRVIVIDDDYCI